MRSFTIFSASFLLAALPYVLAAPTISNSAIARDTVPVAARHAIAVNEEDDDDAEDDYIVVLAEDENREWDEIFGDMGCNKTQVHSTYTMGKNRVFTMNMKKSRGVTMFSRPNVEMMEKNQKMHLTVMPREEPAKRLFMSRDVLKNSRRFEISKRQTGTWVEQSTAPWNLQRVSSENTVQLNGRSATDLSFRYRFEQTGGAGVDVYVLDTGINTAHVDFQGRAQMIFPVNGDTRDLEGHGTHTAGTVGSRTFGVAKNANIFGLKVFDNDGNGSLADSIAAIEHVMASHSERRTLPGFRGSIISMSLGADSPSPMMEAAIRSAVAKGIHFSVAAGNEGKDACSTTPAGVSAAVDIMTVGATDVNDARANFSNFGPCTNIWGPGTQITSTFIGGNNAIDVLQGTSMACPLITGLMAVELSINPQFAENPGQLKQHMLGLSLQNAISDRFDQAPDVAKPLANNGFPGNP